MKNRDKKFPEEELTPDGQSTGFEREIDDDNTTEITNPFDPSKIDIKTKSVSVDNLIKRIHYNEIDLMPDFQRKSGIWKPQQKSRLIESLLLRIPLPVFYVSANEDENWIIVDGLQRLTTLRDFIPFSEQENDAKSILKEKHLEFLKEFECKRFYQLPRAMQRRILETELVFHIIQPSTPKGVTRTIFRRLNTGGLSLSAQEIRHALYQGKSTRLLKELAESEAFQQATNHSIKDDRMADRECVLRFLAFTLTRPEEYQVKDLDGFLSKTMEQLNEASDEEIRKYRNQFKRAMLIAKQIFGKDAFRKMYSTTDRRYPISKTLFETWSVELNRLSKPEISILVKNKELLLEKFKFLLEGSEYPTSLDKHSDFEKAILQTADVRSVHDRFKVIRALIADVLQESDE
jgi:hypothetical protein